MENENTTPEPSDSFLGLSDEPQRSPMGLQEPVQEPAAAPPDDAEQSGPPPGHPRWGEVYGKMKEAQRGAEALTASNEKLNAELLALRTEISAHRESTSELVGNIDEKIEAVTERLGSGDLEGHEQAKAISELSQLNTNKVLVGMQMHGQQQAAEADFAQQRAVWQRKAVEDFGISEKDMKPELVKKAAEFYRADPGLQGLVNGEYYSLAMASLEQSTDGQAAAAAMRDEIKVRDQVEAGARQAASTSVKEGVKEDLISALETPRGSSVNRDHELGKVFAKHQLWTDKTGGSK